jgi:hypothetical protein
MGQVDRQLDVLVEVEMHACQQPSTAPAQVGDGIAAPESGAPQSTSHAQPGVHAPSTSHPHVARRHTPPTQPSPGSHPPPAVQAHPADPTGQEGAVGPQAATPTRSTRAMRCTRALVRDRSDPSKRTSPSPARAHAWAQGAGISTHMTS